MEKLKHVKPSKEYEQEALEYINEFYEYNSDINGTGGLQRYLDISNINYNEVFLVGNGKIRFKLPTEPQLNFQSDKGNTFKTFKEALKDSTGGDMNVLFDDQVVGVINSEQNLDTFGGTVNHLIASNILSESTIVENGKVYLKAEGFDPLKQLINEDFLKEYFPLSKITRDGKVEVLERVEPSVIRDVFRTFSPSEGQLSEETLKDRMLNFLKEVGITVTSIENYVWR